MTNRTDDAPLRRRTLGWSLALLATAQLIISLDINIVFVALPDIGSSLGFEPQMLQWVVSAYTVIMGGFMLLGGRASDVTGQKKVFITALSIYAAASLLGGLAWTPEILIGARVLQGIGGSTGNFFGGMIKTSTQSFAGIYLAVAVAAAIAAAMTIVLPGDRNATPE